MSLHSIIRRHEINTSTLLNLDKINGGGRYKIAAINSMRCNINNAFFIVQGG
jgi:hypothetical protein